MVLNSHLVHNGVHWLGAHVLLWHALAAKQYSQQQPRDHAAIDARPVEHP